MTGAAEFEDPRGTMSCIIGAGGTIGAIAAITGTD
jgi:hypothetical protein